MNDREAFEAWLDRHVTLKAINASCKVNIASITWQAALAHARQQAEPVAYQDRAKIECALIDAQDLCNSLIDKTIGITALRDRLRAALGEFDAALSHARQQSGDSGLAFEVCKECGIYRVCHAAAPAQPEPPQQDIDDAFREIGTSPLKVVAKMVAVPQQSAEPVALDEHDEFMATAAYMTCAYELPRDPKPSRDWQLFRDGWLSAANVYAAPPAQQAEPVALPKVPDPALINSMAMRYRHDFGLLDPREQDSICTTMRQLWEEVVGLGFYRAAPPADDENARLLAANRDLMLHFNTLKSDYDEAVRLLRDILLDLDAGANPRPRIDAYLAKKC